MPFVMHAKLSALFLLPVTHLQPPFIPRARSRVLFRYLLYSRARQQAQVAHRLAQSRLVAFLSGAVSAGLG
jgi:hypothetical protein